MAGELRLRPPHADDELAARAGHAALGKEGHLFLLGLDATPSWAEWVESRARHRVGRDLPPNWVPTTFLFAVVEGALVGRTSIRHRLNADLRRVGGHIGYAVLPEHRRQGYATEILRQSLVIARSYDVDRALLTCDADNPGSAAVIERCGGMLEDVIEDPPRPVPVRRYWIS